MDPLDIIVDWGLGWQFCLGRAIEGIARAHQGLGNLAEAVRHLRRAEVIQEVGGTQWVPAPAEGAAVKVAQHWRLPPRLGKALEFIVGGWPGQAADELEQHLDEVWPRWREYH